MKNFQIILLVVFGIFAALAAAFFSGAIELPKKASETTFGVTGNVTMWGTLSKSALRDTLEFFNSQSKGELVLNYIQKDPKTYKKELLDSFAFGGTPDIFMLSQDLIFLYQDKIITVPYQGFSERMFLDSYIQAASVFKTEAGILGFPILSDPLIMYYNKDIFDSSGIVSPPTSWKEFFTIVPILTKKTETLEIQKSGLAFGEAKNVRNFKEILLAMNFQLGNDVVVRDTIKSSFETVFSGKSFISSKPAEETLKFYMEFSNPLKNVYSWNKSMPDSMDAFIAGDLAVYFGFASEISLIQQKNPNLNFDIALLPQVEGASTSTTYANVHALVIPKTTKNFQAAYSVVGQFTNGPFALPVSLVSGLSPVRRDLLSVKTPESPYRDLYYRAALQSRSWVDPESTETNAIFTRMIENVLSGLSNYGAAVGDANKELKTLLAK